MPEPTTTPRPVSVTTEALMWAVAPITVRLAWDPHDPLAVTVWFYDRTQLVDWMFSRELLALGFHGASGELDVRVEPFLDDLLIRLDNGRGHHVWFLLPGDAADRFLADTYRQILLGSEQTSVPSVEFFTAPGGAR